jgi:glycosyltransferase involved in cell wall biosynthesis
MSPRESRILITGPSLEEQGGVGGFYRAVLPYIRARTDATVHYLQIGSVYRRGGAIYPVADQWVARDAIRDLAPQVIVVNPSLDFKSFWRDGVLIQQAKRAGAKVVIFYRGWDESFAEQIEKRWRWLFRQIYLQGDLFVVLASSFRDALRRWGVTAPIELATTAVAAELVDKFSFAEKQARLRQDSRISILFLARLLHAKGVMETLEAVTTLAKRGLPLRVTIAGDGAARDDVTAFLAKHDPNGRFLTAVGDARGEKKRRLFEEHEIYCFPTYTEGMPNSVLEAMAFGMPVVTSPVGGLCDFFEDGRMGYLVAPRDAHAVGRALEKLVLSPSLRRQIATYNHSYALDRFLAPAAADRLLATCRSVAGQ